LNLAWRTISATQRKEEVMTESKQMQENHSHSGKWTREGQVRTRKETERTRGTHFLESAENGSSQETAKKARARGTHVLKDAETVQTKNKANERRHLLSGEPGGDVTSRHVTEIKRTSKGNSQPGEYRGRDKSGYGTKVREGRALTLWRTQWGGTGQVM